jgi:hypothetical protein
MCCLVDSGGMVMVIKGLAAGFQFFFFLTVWVFGCGMDGDGLDDCYGKQSNWALIPIDAG